MAGERLGYKFHFIYIPAEDEEEDEQMLDGGMDVFIHDPLDWWTGQCQLQQAKLNGRSMSSSAENPLLYGRGEHLFVHTGREVFIKLGVSRYTNLDTEDTPCLTNPPENYSYTEVKVLHRQLLVY